MTPERKIIYSAAEMKCALEELRSEAKKKIPVFFTKPAKEAERILKLIDEEIAELDKPEYRDMTRAAEENPRVRELINSLYLTYRKSTIELCRYGAVPFTADGILDDKDAVQLASELDSPVEGLKCIFDSHRIMIRLPMLPHRDKPQIGVYVGSGKKVLVKTTRAFGEFLHRALWGEDSYGIDYSEFFNKTLYYLFVDSQSRYLPDNDNHDTLEITNVICSRLPGGDLPTTCRFVYDAYITDAIPAGTYVTVLPRTAQIPSPEEIVDYWTGMVEAEDKKAFDEAI